MAAHDTNVERSASLVIPLKIYQISYEDNAKTLSLICHSFSCKKSAAERVEHFLLATFSSMRKQDGLYNPIKVNRQTDSRQRLVPHDIKRGRR